MKNKNVNNEYHSLISYEDILKFHKRTLHKVGLDDDSNDAVSIGLCEASLRGVDSHGIRLLPHYVDSALYGRKSPTPTYKVINKFPCIATLDADNAFGLAAGRKAIDCGIDMADKFGVGAVSVINSSHPGAMASTALYGARKGYIAFALTHADSLLLSYNGTRPYFGTNPICFAVPRKEREPYVLDMATSKISWNKLKIYEAKNMNIPENLAADKKGNMTISTDDAKSLLPTGSYKGFGLASMVEILCGIFTGMKFGHDIPAMFTTPIEEPRYLGQFYLVMRIDGSIDSELFLERMQIMTDQVRSEPSQKNTKVMLPNDPEIEESNKRKENGIPLDLNTHLAFEKLSKKFNVLFKTSK